ncbi:MAG: HAMP domain-containing sensor histidine kinase [Chitinophagales bacterium]
MKKWQVYSIIFVLTLSLMGLVYVQSIYIKRGLIIQSQIFDQYVNEALVHTAIKIEEEEAYRLLKNAKVDQIYNKTKQFNGNCGMNLQYQNGLVVLEVQKNGTTHSFSGNNLEQIDSLVRMANLGADFERELEYNLLKEYSLLVESITMEFLYGSDHKANFDSTKIFNFLRFELDRIGINTPFNFAILDGYNLRNIVSTFEKINTSTYKTSYKTPIHINVFTGEQAVLIADFPNKRSFLIKSNGQLLLSSFIFILLIVASFGASILIIFHQKKISELKTDFINNMTHELKTPVATISLATEMLNKEKVRENPEKIANYTKIIKDENTRLGNHIESVLQVAQLDREEIKLRVEELDFHELLEDLLLKFQLRLEDTAASIDLHLDATNSKIRGDKNHLVNLLSNLLDNAIKYRSERNLEIKLNTSNRKNDFVFSIEDNGIGMSNSDQKKIFTKFYRVPTGNIHNVKGFGLGLSYVKTIVEAHKGEIEVQSEANKFTRFIVTLPT